MFLAALASDAAIRLDPSILTEYRLHSRNASINPDQSSDPLAGAAAFGRVTAPSYTELVQAARTTSNRDVVAEAEGLQEVQAAYGALRDPSTSRRVFLQHLRALNRYRRAYLVKSEPRLRWALALFSITPSLGRRMYAREVTGRQT
jgi:hypothetical protein